MKMSSPKTEKEHRSSAGEAALPDALVVVDVQNDFCHVEGAMARRGAEVNGAEEVAETIERLASAFRRAGKPVIYIRTEHGEWTNSAAWTRRLDGSDLAAGDDNPPICAEGSWGAQFYVIRPTELDRVITKHRYSAFFGTELETVLRAKGVQSVAITGVATNVCVEATARDAFMRDFETLVVREGCAANHPDEHEWGLRNINTYFGSVVSAARLLSLPALQESA